MSFYSTAEQVIRYSGATAHTLGLNDDSELFAQIETWLVQIKDFIDRDRNKDFSALEDVPPAIENIAMRMCANMIRAAERQRTGSVVKMDATADALSPSDAAIFTEQIKRDLMRIPFRYNMRLSVVGGNNDD